jgi:CubicO group peptidase (beta-lactamase class C family)
VWLEAFLALVIEGYREFMEWWQTRSFLRPVRPAPDEQSDTAEDHAVVTAVTRARSLEDSADAILARHAGKHVGIVLGIRWQGETWTFARGRIGAVRPGSPGPDTTFEIGSVTKVFTATVLADMVEEGLVSLGDPVRRYLPAGVELPVRGRPITLADLATQTSGLPRLPPGLLRRSLRQRSNPYAGFTELDLQRAVTRTRLKSSPGTKLGYSNFGFGLLGYVLARRTRQPFEQLVRDRVCCPLGLDDTRIAIPADARGASPMGTTGAASRCRNGTSACSRGQVRFDPRSRTCCACSSCSFSPRARGSDEPRRRPTSPEHIVASSRKGSAGRSFRSAATPAR